MSNKYLFLILILSICKIQWLNYVFAAPNMDSQRQMRGSTTTICVEIKPSTPQEEPFYMCKEADFQSNQKRPNGSSDTGQARLSNGSHQHDNKFQSFRSEDNEFPENPYPTADSKSQSYFKKKTFHPSANIPAEIYSLFGLRAPSYPIDQNSTEAGFSQKKEATTSHGTATHGCTYAGSNHGHTGCEHWGTTSFYQGRTGSEYPNTRYYSQRPSTSRFQTNNKDKPSASVFESTDDASQRNGNQNGRDFGIQSSYEPDRRYQTEVAHGQLNIPNDRILATSQGTYSKDFPKESRKTPSITNDSSVKVSPSFRVDETSTIKKPISKLEDDVLGIPNWNFSLGEYNLLSGLENPIAITNQENYPQPERNLEEIDYIDDPVMRTFYESFQNSPSEMQLRNHLLGETYTTLATPTTFTKDKSLPPSSQKEAVANSECLGNKDVFSPYMYQPIVISMPCCNIQNNPDYMLNNNNNNKRNQNVVDSVLGNPLTQFLGLEKPSPFQNFLSLFNTGLHNLLGAPNPMYNHFHPLNYNHQASNLLPQNHHPIPPHIETIRHLQQPMYLPFHYSHATYPYPTPSLQSLQPTLQLPNQENQAEIRSQKQNLDEYANIQSIGQDPTVSFPNPLKFLTKIPDVVKNVQEKLEKHFEESNDSDKSAEGKKSSENNKVEIVNEQTSTVPIITKPEVHYAITTETSMINMSTEMDKKKSSTADPADLINSQDQEDNKKFIDYTIKARALAHKSKDSWRKRSNIFSTLRKDENFFEQTS